MVLVRPAEGRVEQELPPRVAAREEAVVVDAEVDRPNPLLLDLKMLDDRRGGVVRDRDHETALPDRPAVDDSPIDAFRG